MNTRFIHSSNLYDTCMHDSNLGQIMEVRYNSMLLIKDVLFVVKQDMQSLSVVQYVVISLCCHVEGPEDVFSSLSNL